MILRVAVLCLLLVVTSALEWRGPLRGIYPNHGPLKAEGNASVLGEPLFLTPLIEAGKIQEARKLSRVSLGHRYGHSFSGYLTVNKKFGSNLFFWFFPARKTPDSSPVVVWLQGGPGGSSLFGLFAEHGPFKVNEKMHLLPRKYAWTKTMNVLYIDNPVGTGFSFTKDEAGYARNETDVGRDLYSAIVQFYQLFPELSTNNFFVTGESYAGKYVPALTYTIHKNNPTAKFKIPLKGMAIGDGLCDPVSMVDYGDFLYQIGLVDDLDRMYFKQQSDLAVQYINNKQWIEAFNVFDSLLNGDKTGAPSYFTNVTGLNFYFNYLLSSEPKDMDYWVKFVNKQHVRGAIHVGNMTFNNGSVVETYLLEDIMKSVKPWIEEILDNYLVLFYNGQLDVIIAYTLTENFLRSLDWKHATEFNSSPRYIWKVDDEVAGYVREVPNIVQVMIRNAGHMVPYDQPKWAYDMMERFTSVQTLSDNKWNLFERENRVI
ncbi:putative serine carboxypeptidase CPVL [Oratosquilla oratoria]|uniref:putative serine carboxypeptidase CPVL n=1 Tax=Oratosquilla oratoria TaxID=337810 RepID=UPI003F76589E